MRETWSPRTISAAWANHRLIPNCSTGSRRPFIEEGGNLKKLHRRIVLSRVYQLSSDGPATSQAADPANKYLWRHHRRLLHAEAVRDSLLFVSGQLDLMPAEAHPFPPLSDKNFASFSLNRPFASFYPTTKRSVYVMTSRLRPHPELDLFNGPNRNASTSRRTTETSGNAPLGQPLQVGLSSLRAGNR